jgi:hypothetical protein
MALGISGGLPLRIVAAGGMILRRRGAAVSSLARPVLTAISHARTSKKPFLLA